MIKRLGSAILNNYGSMHNDWNTGFLQNLPFPFSSLIPAIFSLVEAPSKFLCYSSVKVFHVLKYYSWVNLKLRKQEKNPVEYERCSTWTRDAP